jgi:hypothetical protein
MKDCNRLPASMGWKRANPPSGASHAKRGRDSRGAIPAVAVPLAHKRDHTKRATLPAHVQAR